MRDFVEYWGASRLFVTGGNPYSPVELLALQKSAGWSNGEPLMMWNPPWTLAYIFPLGFLDAGGAQFVWLLANIMFVLAAGQLLWAVNGKDSQCLWKPWLLSLTFVPTIFALVLGQITPLILLALALLLYCESKNNWFGFGCAVAILFVKPHLVFLFWVVFVLWFWRGRNWRVICGVGVVGGCTALFPLIFNSRIYRQYFGLHTVDGVTKPFEWPTPTLGNVAKLLFNPNGDWIHFVFPALAMVWVIWYWRRHKQSWRWTDHMPLLVTVSLAASYFSWTYDEVVLLPALLQGAAWLGGENVTWYRSRSALFYVAINLAHCLQRVFVAVEFWYFWLAPAMLIVYILFQREAGLNLKRA